MANVPIEVDFSSLTIGDLALFDAFKNNSASQADMVKLLDRVVVGGASRLPLTRLKDVVDAVVKATEQLVNPVDGQGKA